MSEVTTEQINAGISPYSRFFLGIYDWFVLGLSCRFIWQCPSSSMLEMYNRHITANHLDIGVGTGYFIDRCKFPVPNSRLALLDLNPNSIRAAQKRLARYKPDVYQRNVLEPFNLDIPYFDSIGMMNLLHCLPGGMDNKATVFENAMAVLNPGGVLFGSTILYKGVKRNAFATAMLRIYNRKGIMTNMEDDLQLLEYYLTHYFSESNIEITGCEVLFSARKL